MCTDRGGADPDHDVWVCVHLEGMLWRTSGFEFQRFFSKLMRMKHGDDFVAISSTGGDRGCDGYLRSKGVVYQCYGAEGGMAPKKLGTVRGKINEGFRKAVDLLSGELDIKEWVFVHNLIRDFPIDATTAIETLQRENPHIKISLFSEPAFQDLVLSLARSQQLSLLGTVPTNDDIRAVQHEDIRDLIETISQQFDQGDPTELSEVGPVPVDKLEFNNLPNHWRGWVENGWKHVQLVEDYLSEQPDATLGTNVATKFRNRYQTLVLNGLDPSRIMNELYTGTTGSHASPARQMAAQTLLAYLFESCDIFERMPKGERP